MRFEAFFAAATGYPPHEYQARVARDGLPGLVRAPTGAGKTALILAWLWRRLYGPDPDRTPRRLVYALPRRSLTEPLSGSVRRWLAGLGLLDEVALHVALGRRDEGWGDWREDMHRPAILIGDADLLVSKALNRGYGTGRTMQPVDFALVCNGAQWMVDEVRACPQAAATLRQLAGLTGLWGTTEPLRLTFLTATTAPDAPDAEDTPAGAGPLTEGGTVEIAPGERSGEIAVRLSAGRTIRRAEVSPGDYRALAGLVRAAHRAGTLTLVALNDVPAAQQVGRLLRDGPARCVLLHAQLRGTERAARVADVLAAHGDLIVVSAGEAASGLDLTAALVVAEATPWPSMVRRIGRANRTGALRDGEVWWLPPPTPGEELGEGPGDSHGEASDVAAACAELARLDGVRVTGEDLLAHAVSGARHEGAVLGRDALLARFDTTPPVSPGPDDRPGSRGTGADGADADIGRYVRDPGDPDVEVAWAEWSPREAGAPDPGVRFPPPEYRCRVPLRAAASLAAGRPAWRFDQAAGEWLRVTAESSLRPYDLLLVAAADGGYDQGAGFDPAAPGPVPDCPVLLTPDEAAAAAAIAPGGAVPAPRGWQSLDEHSEQVRDQAAALLAVLAPAVTGAAARAAIVAGYLHDAGKAHPTWQDALCALASASDADMVAAGRPWAKSGTAGPLEFAGGAGFRHELASLLLIDGPLRSLLAASPDADLTRYLVLAHHGRLRVRVSDPSASEPSASEPSASDPDTETGPASPRILGLAQGATSDIPPLLGQPATTLTVDLGQFGQDGDWTGTVTSLLGRYGPFTLAYLETVVRVADWRASGGRELPESVHHATVPVSP